MKKLAPLTKVSTECAVVLSSEETFRLAYCSAESIPSAFSRTATQQFDNNYVKVFCYYLNTVRSSSVIEKTAVERRNPINKFQV